MTDDLVMRLLADELPNDGQWEKEARMVLHSLLKEAAGEIQQNQIDLEEYRRDVERFQKLVAALREIADGSRDADKSYVSLFHEIQSEARKALEGKDD